MTLLSSAEQTRLTLAGEEFSRLSLTLPPASLKKWFGEALALTSEEKNSIKVSATIYGRVCTLSVSQYGEQRLAIYLSSVFEGKKGISIQLYSNGYLSNSGDHKSFDYAALPTTLEGVTQLVKEMFTFVAEKYRSPVVPSGCVRAFLSAYRLLWVNKRTGSDKIAKIGEDYFLVANNTSDFHKAHRTEEDFDYFHASEGAPLGARKIKIGGRYQTWYIESLVPLYAPSVPFTEISDYTTPARARRDFETVVIDGETRHINVRRTSNVSTLFEDGVIGYTTRIETVIPADKLFKKGEQDLYSRRPNDETPFLGWELEACCNLSSLQPAQIANVFKAQLPYLVICKSDASIRPAGFETVSIPATLDAWKESPLIEALNVMKSKLYNMRSFEHSSCGFHVHVSRSALSVLDLQKMERFMHNPANRDFLSQVAGRGSVHYAEYNNNLFSGRGLRSVSTSNSRITMENERAEDIIWFYGTKRAKKVLLITYSGHTGAQSFSMWANDYINFSSVDSALRTTYPEILQSLRGRSFFGSIEEVSGDYFSEEMLNALHVVASFGPTLNLACRHFFPDIDFLVVEDVSEIATPCEGSIPKWKYERKKTSLPFKRTQSYEASQRIAGAVGKGEARYDVLNTKNKNTVEFRLFKGTMNPTSVFRYLEFVDALVRFVASTSATDEGVNYTTFTKWLVTDSFNAARYENLVAFLIEKELIERKTVRRHTLVEVQAKDGHILDHVVAKKFEVVEEPVAPLYNIVSAPSTVVNNTFASTFAVAVEEEIIFDDDDYRDEVEPEGFDGNPDLCNCSDCVSLRGHMA